MNDAADYIARIKSILISEPSIVKLKIIREESQGQLGLYRYRASFDNGDMLEMFERFTIKSGQIEITKYSFQWQNADGILQKRWDNAPHHSNLSTHPDHVHDGTEDVVLPHSPITAAEILKMILVE